MKIGFLTTEFVTELNFSGGISNYLLRLCLALRDMGHTPIVFVPSNNDQILNYKDIEVHRLKVRTHVFIKILDRLTFKRMSRPLSILSTSFTFSSSLKKKLRKNSLDIIQAASYRATNLFIDKKVPVVVRISSFEPFLRKKYDWPHNIAQKFVEYLEVRALQRANALFAPSRLLANTVKKELNLNSKVIESPFISDTQEFDWSTYNKILDGKPYLLFFGKIGLLKGCKTIADILEPLLLNHENLHFVFIGNDSLYRGKSMLDYVMEHAGSVKERIIHSGELHHTELYPIIKKAIGVVLPSRIDNFPNTCIEAMFFGQLVVGTHGTSLDQLIKDGVSGFLCFPDDAASLMKAINKVLSLSEKEREIISENARKRIEQLVPQKVVKDLISFFEDTIKASK